MLIGPHETKMTIDGHAERSLQIFRTLAEDDSFKLLFDDGEKISIKCKLRHLIGGMSFTKVICTLTKLGSDKCDLTIKFKTIQIIWLCFGFIFITLFYVKIFISQDNYLWLFWIPLIYLLINRGAFKLSVLSILPRLHNVFKKKIFS